MLKEKNLQPRLIYSERISFRFDRELKTFTDEQKLREFNTTKPALQQMLKEFSRQETQKKENTYNSTPKTIKKMVIGTYISINTLNVKGLIAPTKKIIDWLNGYKNKTLYMLSTRDPLQT